MTYWKAILLGAVQGLAEFLPISSSGHLAVVQYLMGDTGEDVLLMNTLLHIGTLAAIFICFRKTIAGLFVEAVRFIKDIFSRRYHFDSLREDVRAMPLRRKMLLYYFISCVPLLFLLLPIGGGLSVRDRLAVFSTDDSILAEGVCFILTGLLLIAGAMRARRIRKHRNMDFFTAFSVGVAQLFAAAFPGVSRSGSTISAGLLCGVSKEEMVRYSFILSIPAVLAANLSELGGALSGGTQLQAGPVLVGILTAALTGVGAIALLRRILQKNLFRYFGYYCIGMGVFCIGVTIAMR